MHLPVMLSPSLYLSNPCLFICSFIALVTVYNYIFCVFLQMSESQIIFDLIFLPYVFLYFTNFLE